MEKIKGFFRESFFGFLFYKIKNFSLIRLFFDFDYTGRLFEKSFIKSLFKRGTEKSPTLKTKRTTQNVFALLISLNLYLGESSVALLLGGVLALYFLLSTEEENFKILIMCLGFLTAFIYPFLPLFQTVYILYVETGIVLFFIIKYSDDLVYGKVLLYTSVLWLFLNENPYLVLSVFPYALLVLGKGKIKKHIYGAFLLSAAFYFLSYGGYPALVGGAMGILFMIVLGELWLIVPSLLTAPWVIGFGVRLIREGLLPQNIIRTGWFFWKHGFGGGGITVPFGGGAGGIISVMYGIVLWFFFWYVLRAARRGIVKSFKAKGEKAEILRAGLGSVLALSVYSFLTGGHNLPYTVIVYLVSGGLLKRACL